VGYYHFYGEDCYDLSESRALLERWFNVCHISTEAKAARKKILLEREDAWLIL